MITGAQCKLEAAHFTEKAELFANITIRDDYLALATEWLRVGAVADFQDSVLKLNKVKLPS